MSRLRILLLAPEASPDSICGPLIGYSQAQALAKLHDVTLVIRSYREEAVRRKQGDLYAIEVIKLRRLDPMFAWVLHRVFKDDSNTHAHLLHLFRYPLCVAFEWQAWRQLRHRISAGEFDIVMRLLPVTAVQPSPFAYFLRNGPVPFVIGPVSGGLPWPKGFSQAQRQKQWLSGLRGLYRFLPFARSTYRRAASIIAGSSQTFAELSRHKEKLFFVLENGVDPSLCSGGKRSLDPSGKLELIFVGGLVPIKGCDLALRAASALLREDLARFTVVGDGPERNRLELLTRSLGIEKAVSFCGWLSHEEALKRLGAADILVFPSVRDNSPAVVFEALAAGTVPLVADHGGPGDIVRPEVGFKVTLTNEADVVAQMQKILTDLAADRELLSRLQQQGISYARDCLTWDAKAKSLTSILNWALRKGPRPSLPPPKMLGMGPAS